MSSRIGDRAVKLMTERNVDFSKHNWTRLNKVQLGRYAEYLVKMEFVLYGCDVFTAEVDDHGIDFVVRTRVGNHYDVQVKSYTLRAGRGTPYVFLPKRKFEVCPSLLLALVQFIDGEPPTMFLLPSCVDGGKPNPLFESRDYGDGKQSEPEWGLTLSKRKLASLAHDCSFHSAVAVLK